MERNDICVKKKIGIRSYVLVWYYNQDTTLCVSMETLEKMKQNEKKSLRFDAQEVYNVKGTKKSRYFEYDMRDLLDYIVEEK